MKKIGIASFETRAKAEELIETLSDLIDEYGSASVADVKDFLGQESYYNDTCQGWVEADFEVLRYNSSETIYSVEGPKPIKLKNAMYESTDKMVSHPSHYQSETGLEVIDVIKAFTANLKGIEATDTGNVIKYICRWNEKNGIQDLEKAQWYLTHLIEEVKNREPVECAKQPYVAPEYTKIDNGERAPKKIINLVSEIDTYV